jgi:hypothetical protein
MSDLFLDLRDKTRVVDFLVEQLEYAGTKDRAPAEKCIAMYQEGERVPTDKLASVARTLAKVTWPARYALRRFFNKEGSGEEWDRVLAAVRPSTAHLLQRLQKSQGGGVPLDAVLASDDAGVALHDPEQSEIAEIRGHLRHDYWKANAKKLSVLVEEGQTELDGMLTRLATLRDMAIEMPRTLQDEVFTKIASYEDRIFFEGEVIPIEILDNEVTYYRDQKEISPLE